MLRTALSAALRRPGTWLLIAANAVPLLGALCLGWDAPTLVILYWLETAIIGFWVIVRVACADASQLGASTRLAARDGVGLTGPGLAAFVLAHASIFMLVHFFFLTGLMPGEWTRHIGSVQDFFLGFVIPSGIWVPLAGLFLVRGLIAASEIRARAPTINVLAGFYMRIVILQVTILLGGFLALAVGGVAMLALLILIKTAADVFIELIGAYAAKAMEASLSTSDGA